METFIIVNSKGYTPCGYLSYGELMDMWLAADTDGMSPYLCAVHGDKVVSRRLTEEQAERLAVLLRQRA